MKQHWNLVLILSVLTSCNDSEEDSFNYSDMESDPTDYPTLLYTKSEAEDLYEGTASSLIDETCVKIEPLEKEEWLQKWKCEFSFNVNQEIKECSAILSYQADDHFSYWGTEKNLKSGTNELETTLSCKDETN